MKRVHLVIGCEFESSSLCHDLWVLELHILKITYCHIHDIYYTNQLRLQNKVIIHVLVMPHTCKSYYSSMF